MQNEKQFFIDRYNEAIEEVFNSKGNLVREFYWKGMANSYSLMIEHFYPENIS
jgi:hypothetical protein